MYWNNRGRRPLATSEDIDEFKKKSLRISSSTICNSQIEAFLNGRKRIREAEKNNFSPTPISPNTLGFYKAYMSADHDIVHRSAVSHKDQMRFASETSLRMVTSYIMCVAATHLSPGNPPIDHPAQHNFGDDGSKLLADCVARAEGVSCVYPINPALITSTDDTTLYLTDCVEDTIKDSIRLALRDVNQDSRNMASKNYFISSPKPKKLGMRVKLTCTFSANGNTAAIFIIINGLSEIEMPSSVYPEGYLVEPINGLSTASAIDPSTHKPGYIAFVRRGKNFNPDNMSEVNNRSEMSENQEDIDEDDDCPELNSGVQKCIEYYGKHVLIPFIKSQRENCSFSLDSDIERDDLACCWFDGDINQIKVFSSADFLKMTDEETMNLIKQCCKRTTVEQAADVGEIFKKIK